MLIIFRFAYICSNVSNLISDFYELCYRKKTKITFCEVSGNELNNFELRPRGQTLSFRLSEGKLRMRYSFLVYQAIDVIPKEWFSIARRHDTVDAEDYGRKLTRYSVQESKQRARMSWYRFEYHPGILLEPFKKSLHCSS